MQVSNLLGLVILLPFLAALLIWCFRKVEKLYLLLPLCAIFAIYIGVQPSILFQSYPNLFFGSELILDTTSRSFLLLSGVLWLLASTYRLFIQTLGIISHTFLLYLLWPWEVVLAWSLVPICLVLLPSLPL